MLPNHRLSQRLGKLLVSTSIAVFTLVVATPAQGWVAEDGGLKDTATGTVWSNVSCDSGRQFPYCFFRDEALAYAAQLTQGGFTDWRIPSKVELGKACADGAYAALTTHPPYADSTDWNRGMWTTDLKGKRYPYWVYLPNCVTRSVGEGSTTAVVCARGPVFTKGGGKKGGGGKPKSVTTPGGSSTERYGIATSGCHGVPVIDANGDPLAGTNQFALTCTYVPKQATGVLLLAHSQASILFPELRLRLLVDPSSIAITHVVHADARGSHTTELPLPLGTRGAKFFGQFVWLDPACSTQQLSASMGLAVRVQ